MKKVLIGLIFIAVWLGLIVIGPYTALKLTPLAFVSSNSGRQIILAQRIVGLIAFSLLFVQIVLGAFMDFWEKIIGKWIEKFHFFQGSLIALLIIIHPILFGVFKFLINKKFDPFYIFTDFCALCSQRSEYFYTFGRLAFWAMLVGITAALFRHLTSLKKSWRKFHTLNYLAFFLVALHLYGVGPDVFTKPFIYFWPIALIIILISGLYKLTVFIKSN